MILLLQMSFQEFLQVLLHFRMMFQDQMSRVTEVQDLVHLGIHRVSVFVLVLDEHQAACFALEPAVVLWQVQSWVGIYTTQESAEWEQPNQKEEFFGMLAANLKNRDQKKKDGQLLLGELPSRMRCGTKSAQIERREG